MLWVWDRQGQGQGPRWGPRHVAVGEANRGHHMRMWSCAGPKVLGPDARGRQAWSWGDARCIGRHGPRAMPKVAVANTSECVAERSRLMAERGQRLAVGVKPKAARQSKGLYDVVIQRVWPGIGPEGMPVIVALYKAGAQGVEARSQGGQG